MKQAVSIKTNQMVQKRKKFESQPLFLKAGLYFLAKYDNVRKQGFYQRYAVSDHLKVRGNKLFKAESVELAAREYEQALSILRYINNKNPNWRNEGIIDEDLEYINFDGEGEEEKAMATSIKVALYNNLAACYLNLADYKNAIAACDETLLLDPTQAKAWFRRAKALTSDINAGVEEFKAALEDLKKALELSPDDSVIQQALNKIKHDLIKAKNSAQSFKGIFQTKNDKKPEDENSIEKTLPNTEPETPKTETSAKSKEEPKIQALATNQQGKGNIKEEKPIEVKKEREKVKKVEEKKEEVSKKSTSGVGPKMEKDNEVWKMLHGNKDPNSEDYDYALSYESKKNAQTPQEIAELEKFLEKRGNDLLRLYESTGRTQQAHELRENLKKAMAAKQRLEKIATLDFDKPNSQLQEVADKFGLDLNDPAIKDELKKIQTQNLDDIRNWIKGMSPEGSEPVSSKPKKDKTKAQANVTTTNNYYINNNYYSSGPEGLEHILGDKKKGQQEHDLRSDVSKLKENESSAKTTRIMNIVIIAAAIGLFLISLFMQNNRTPSSSTVSKEI